MFILGKKTLRPEKTTAFGLEEKQTGLPTRRTEISPPSAACLEGNSARRKKGEEKERKERRATHESAREKGNAKRRKGKKRRIVLKM